MADTDDTETEERYPSDIARDLVEWTKPSEVLEPNDLNDALYTLSEGGAVRGGEHLCPVGAPVSRPRGASAGHGWRATGRIQPLMLLLTAPFGYGNGYHISLRSAGAVSDESLEEVLVAYSCYPPAISKIKASLRHSCRYDCVVQSAWFKKQARQLASELREIGVELTILGRPDYMS